MSQGVNPYSVTDSQIQLLATLDSTQQEGTQDPVSQPQTDASDLDADHEDGTPTDSNGPGHMTTLPEYATVQLDRFTLGPLGGEAGSSAINDAYAEAVHYRPNAFEVPNGSAGRAFVAQLSKYLLCFGNAGSFEGQALKVAMVFQQLLLQRPFRSSSMANAKCLQRRLDTWQQGDLGQLLHECRTIQSQLEKQEKRQQSRESDSARHFASLVETGKLGSALRQLSDGPSGGIHYLDDVIGDASVRDILKDKHPQAEPLHLDAVIPGQAPAPPHSVLFESLTREVVRRAALHTQGAAGPSGVDADSWRRMCTSFGECSDELCDALAKCARRLATYVDPTSLEAYVAYRLIPLDKKPGVRPIGIGEVMRRILGKAILRLTNQDIKEAAGSLQLCAGQENGIEAAIHAMHDVFQDEETEGILLADASNAFNRLNRAVCLRNVQHLCPSLAPTVINSYRQPARLFVGGECIMSSEGTTQGDPIAMPMYAIGVVPLLQSIATEGAVQAWFADDSGAGGKVLKLCQWWDSLTEKGPSFGYLLNAAKSVLLVKPQHYHKAVEVFAGTGVDIRMDGCRHLGAALGSPEFITRYLQQKAEAWVQEVSRLTEIAATQPQAPYSVFVLGLEHKWTFLSRVMSDVDAAMAPVEAAVVDDLIPALSGRPVSLVERELLALPCRHEGMGLTKPTSLGSQYISSRRVSAPISCRIAQQVRAIKRKVASDGRNGSKAEATILPASLEPEMQHVISLASKKGSSSWLTCRPLARHGFSLSKGEFQDAICLRYNWLPPRLPSSWCCGRKFDISHALSCPTGGFPLCVIMRFVTPLPSCSRESPTTSRLSLSF